MRIKSTWLVTTAVMTLGFGLAPPAALHAQGSAALTGQVSSAEEGAMEGVLVTARRTGASFTVTVVTDEKGHYSFPASRLEPGHYTLAVRAAGYDTDGALAADVSADKAATADVKLHKIDDPKKLASTLSNGEWIMSVPGSDQQKMTLTNCVSCHTLERIVRSTHDANEFATQVLPRMAGYANQSMPIHPQKRHAERLLEERGDQRTQAQQAMAKFLASINLSEHDTWQYPLQTLPRPKGKATHVIITEYDLPRPTAEPHDVIVDRQGIAWYSNFGEQTFGRLDPKTGKVTEFPVPEEKKGWPTGMLALHADKSDNIWIGMMYQGAMAKFDPKTDQFQVFNLPPDMNKDMAQVNMVRAESEDVDGKVWSQNNGFAAIHRLDVATGKIETIAPFKNAGVGENHNIYDIMPDSKNNLYFTDIAADYIGRVDAKTEEVKLYPLPTKPAGPRRGMMDSQERVWFGEYRGNKIGMFDTKSETFKEWKMPTPWSAPYDVVVDKNGEAWTGSMLNDLVDRLDPKTGQVTEYLMPRETNIRRVFVDNSTNPVTFWVGNNHRASIVKLEPLD
ncbi:MAG TPA: carboxypeptidase regulatory-like domain-containing protein [Xanthobacteraceae bacterium]|nr:carboxypeptidase regulatory-like domain-containing protein [Xanthobacteraceae bacterium]